MNAHNRNPRSRLWSAWPASTTSSSPTSTPAPAAVAVTAVAAAGYIAAACGLIALLVWLLSRPPQGFGPALLLGLVALGLWAASRRRLVNALAVQVDQLRTERQLREQAVRLAERSAIAAEMHDVLAHRLSLIALHTGVLADRADALPRQIGERLTLLRTTSTEALADLRDILGALRTTDTAEGREPGSLTPAIQDLQELIGPARAAGQDIDLITEGDPAQAPAAHRLAAYRIVREALTNARKHAHGAQVTVRVNYAPPITRIEVTNTAGPAAPRPTSPGFGLIGLRERVEALHGELSTGPAPGATWRIAAHIPHHATTQNSPDQ